MTHLVTDTEAAERDTWQLLLDDLKRVKAAGETDMIYALTDAWAAHIGKLEADRQALIEALERWQRWIEFDGPDMDENERGDAIAADTRTLLESLRTTNQKGQP